MAPSPSLEVETMDYVYPVCVCDRHSMPVFWSMWVSVTVRVGALRGFVFVLQPPLVRLNKQKGAGGTHALSQLGGASLPPTELMNHCPSKSVPVWVL